MRAAGLEEGRSVSLPPIIGHRRTAKATHPSVLADCVGHNGCKNNLPPELSRLPTQRRVQIKVFWFRFPEPVGMLN